MQANCFSSFQQRTHGLANAELSDVSVAAATAGFAFTSLVLGVVGTDFAFDSEDEDDVSLVDDCDAAMSTSVALGGGMVGAVSRTGTFYEITDIIEIEDSQMDRLTNLLSNHFHLNAGNHNVLFLSGNVLNLFLKTETSDVKITVGHEIII